MCRERRLSAGKEVRRRGRRLGVGEKRLSAGNEVKFGEKVKCQR